MELENQLPSFEGFFKKAHYNSNLVLAGYQSRQDFLRDFEQKFVSSRRSLNRPKWERLPYFEAGISVVKKIKLTFVTGTGKRSAFSKY
jgi:hypothetical protein